MSSYRDDLNCKRFGFECNWNYCVLVLLRLLNQHRYKHNQFYHNVGGSWSLFYSLEINFADSRPTRTSSYSYAHALSLFFLEDFLLVALIISFGSFFFEKFHNEMAEKKKFGHEKLSKELCVWYECSLPLNFFFFKDMLRKRKNVFILSIRT